MRAQQPQIAGARDRLARCLGLSIGGIIGIVANCWRGRVLGGVCGQGFGRIAVGHGISSRREDARKFIRRETKRCEVNFRSLDARQRITQQRLVPGGVLCDAIISKPQRFLLRGCEVLPGDGMSRTS
jgi:hypothetical protein